MCPKLNDFSNDPKFEDEVECWYAIIKSINAGAALTNSQKIETGIQITFKHRLTIETRHGSKINHRLKRLTITVMSRDFWQKFYLVISMLLERYGER